MIEYLVRYYDKLLDALVEHIEIVVLCLFFSLVLAAILTIIAMCSKVASTILLNVFSVIYSIPSLAVFALLIPLTGLGVRTAIIALVAYNQYLLLRNFITGLNDVDPAIVDAATGMGMTRSQVLFKVRLPLATGSLFAGIRIAVVSTIGIATIAAVINAGGLGDILFDGLRTMNIYKIVWGSLLSAGLAIVANCILGFIQRRLERRGTPA